MALEATGAKIIHLELGEPDFDTPAHISEAAHRSMRNGRTHYDSSIGDIALRQAIAAYLHRSRQITCDPSEIIVTQGVKGGIFMTLMALIETGDEVLLPAPFYPPYAEIVRFAGGRGVDCPLVETGFQIEAAHLEQFVTPKTKAIIINSPANPTGVILSEASLTAVAHIAQKHNLWVISDEIYIQINFTVQQPATIYTLPGMAERTILLDGFSKPYAMTGWRLGFGVFPEVVKTAVLNIIVQAYSSLPLFIQDAGTVALNGSQDAVVRMREIYRGRRDTAVQLTNDIPNVTAPFPEGAFYLYLDISQTGQDAQTLAYQLLEQGVAFLPIGSDHLRVAFTRPKDEIAAGLEILANALRQ